MKHIFILVGQTSTKLTLEPGPHTSPYNSQMVLTSLTVKR